MPYQVENSEWNRHGAADRCLLGNWVEHRSVGEHNGQKNEKGRYMDHQNLLAHPSATDDEGAATRYVSESSQAGASVHVNKQKRVSLAKQRAVLEAELLRRARDDIDSLAQTRVADTWMSTNHSDFALPFPEKQVKLDSATAEQFKTPITYWSHQARLGLGNVNATTPSSALAGQNDNSTVSFGRHDNFSTPIAHSLNA